MINWHLSRYAKMVQPMKINVINHINRMKDKNHKVKCSLIIKTFNQTGKKDTYLTIIKAIYKKTTGDIILDNKNLKLSSKTPNVTIFIQHHTEVLPRTIRQGKEKVQYFCTLIMSW